MYCFNIKGRKFLRLWCRGLLVVLLMGLIGAVAPIEASAENVASGSLPSGVLWCLTDDGELHLSGNGAVPDFKDETETPWYPYRERVKRITLAEGITEIGKSAFATLPVYRVTFPETLTVIGKYAFRECLALAEVRIPNGLVMIREEAFSGCVVLHTAYLPGTLTDVGEGIFYGCNSFSTIHFGGTEEAFKAISLGDHNGVFKGAEVRFESPVYQGILGHIMFVLLLATVVMITIFSFIKWLREHDKEKRVFGARVYREK